MGYTITITNTSVNYVEPKVVDLETISPSLITEPNVPIEEYTSDVTNSDTFVYVPLYKRAQYVKLEAGTSLIIKTDNTDETMYYLNMNLDNVSVTVETGPSDAGLPEVNSDDNGKVLTVVDGVWNKAEPSGSDEFLITLTHTGIYPNFVITADKTASEIFEVLSTKPESIAFYDIRNYYCKNINISHYMSIYQISFCSMNCSSPVDEGPLICSYLIQINGSLDPMTIYIGYSQVQLPNPNKSDTGKVMKVDNNGYWSIQEP